MQQNFSIRVLDMLVSQALIQRLFRRCYSSQAQLVPVIKIPAYVKKYVEQKKKDDAMKQRNLKRKVTYRGDTSIPVISSTNKEFNFYLGQKYNERYALPLQSKFWFKTKSSGQKFSIHPWDTNPSLPVVQNERHTDDIYFPKAFSELLTSQNILLEIDRMGFESPTPIQVLTIPQILDHKHVLLAAETGCGKSVAYLAPIIQNISSVKRTTELFPDTPLALVITPGRELAEQIGRVAYDLAKSSGINVRVLVSDGTEHRHLKLTENSDVDLLVASFGTIAKLVTKGIFKLGSLRHIVLDEADTLLDDSFIFEMNCFLRKLPLLINSNESLNKPYGTQLTLVSSTYPTNADSMLVELVEKEDLVKIKSPYLHRVLPHVNQRFWRVSNDSRAGILLDLVKSDYEKKSPVIIFSNHSPTCDWMSTFLKGNGVHNVRFHAGLTPVRRAASLEAFLSGDCTVMCCTDLASRGIDTQNVKHLINFDFPTSVSDYILRAGRVGRVGTNQGRITNLIVSAPGVYTVQEIERSVKSSIRIPDVDANIKRKITKLYFQPQTKIDVNFDI